MKKQPSEILEEFVSYCSTNYNQLAKTLNIKRSQNLYDIRDGKMGISGKLAAKMVALKPEVDICYLLTGEGKMLKNAETAIPPAQSDVAAYSELIVALNKRLEDKDKIIALLEEKLKNAVLSGGQPDVAKKTATAVQKRKVR
jgi:hypothetical protein